MKKISNISIIIIILSLLSFTAPGALSQSEKTTPAPLKPLEDVSDILAWKSIRATTLSSNGDWLGYILAPQEGDAEAIVRQTKGKKEYHFPIGEAPRSSGSGAFAFSEDSKWAAFFVYPKRDEAKKLRKQKKKLYNNVTLVNLASGEEIKFDKIKRFAFSEENPNWLALHRYPAESQAKEKEKWSGSDLLLYALNTSNTFNIGNVSEFQFNKQGQWLAWAIDAQDKSGNGIQLRNMQTGVIFALDSGKAEYKRLNWTEKGDGLTAIKGKKDDDYENQLFSVIGFYEFSDSGPKKAAYDPQQDNNFPEGMTISPNYSPLWTDDFAGILFGIHEAKAKDDKAESEDKKAESPEPEKKDKPAKKPDKDIDKEDLPGLVIWHWKDKRMQAMQQVQASRDKNFNYLSIYRLKENKFIRLADDDVRRVIPAPKHRWAIGRDNREYELDGNLYGRRYQDCYIIDLQTGERRLALKKCRWFYTASPDGTHFLYYQDGHFHTYDMASGKTYNITKDVPTSFINTEDDHNVVDPPISPRAYGWTKDGTSLLLYDNWDVWQVPVHGGKGINLTVNGKKDQIRYRQRFRLDPDEKGIDLTQPLYLSPYGEWTKKSGIARIDKGKPGVKMIFWDDVYFSLYKAKRADVFLYSKQTYKDYPDLYATNSSFKDGQKLTNANPQQKDYLWSAGSLLVDYKSDKGDRLQAALFLPTNYQKGKGYPTLVYIYEKNSQNLNRYYAPSARGFNKTVYTSRGYAVLMPDIVYTINDPGMSSVWCVLPAIEAAAATGIVDKTRVGIHGHSWGGYQTAFLVTQTELFKAAVAGAPLTNMISMYSSIYWNSGSANQPIFESSQGRFKGNYLNNLEAYTRNSPVYYAHQVKTPLIILHNDKDGAVDWNQGIEYFNTLRQLKKPVIMLQYKGENHGLRKPPNLKDYYIRMRDFFDHYLMGKPSPPWLESGISHLEHEKHIQAHTKAILKQKKPEKKKEK